MEREGRNTEEKRVMGKDKGRVLGGKSGYWGEDWGKAGLKWRGKGRGDRKGLGFSKKKEKKRRKGEQ